MLTLYYVYLNILVAGFEKICGEVAARGSQESELELKYMLDVMYEAGCASWTLLVWNFQSVDILFTFPACL